MTSRPVAHDVALQAATWLAEIGNGTVPRSRAEALQHWRDADPEHERAWQRADRIRGMLLRIPPAFGTAVLDRGHGQRRRTVVRGLAALLAAGPIAWLAARQLPWDEWNAEFRTATGEQRRTVLADGTVMTLNTASSVDVSAGATLQRVHLLAGEVMLAPSGDSRQRAIPIEVQTRQGTMQALATRFAVRQQAAKTWLTVFDGSVEVRPSSSDVSTTIRAGEQCCFSAKGIEIRRAAGEALSAWTQGVLVADHMRLGDFIAELARYRPGRLECDAAVADRRVSGTFQLKNTDQVLSLIERSLGVVVERRTDYWVTVRGGAGLRT